MYYNTYSELTTNIINTLEIKALQIDLLIPIYIYFLELYY